MPYMHYKHISCTFFLNTTAEMTNAKNLKAAWCVLHRYDRRTCSGAETAMWGWLVGDNLQHKSLLPQMPCNSCLKIENVQFVFIAVSFVNPNFNSITFKLGMSSVRMKGPKVHGNSCALTLELLIQLEKLMILLIEYELIWCHLSCFDAARHPPHLYYHHSKIYLPLALGSCWHGSTHTISVALAPAVELMFASVRLIKLRRSVNIVSSKH